MSEKKKGILAEFKEFALRGNVMDLAIGVIIGAAFQAIVTSLINDLIMPLVGFITGGVNFQDQFAILKLPEGVNAADVTSLAAAQELGVTTLNYGAFVTAVINFLLMAVVVFCLVKTINRLSNLGRKKEEEAPAEPTTKVCPHCCSEIPLEATRCPHCTSELEAPAKEEE